jgi:hypothetical protein
MISHFEIVCHLDLLSKNSLQRHARIPQLFLLPIRSRNSRASKSSCPTSPTATPLRNPPICRAT